MNKKAIIISLLLFSMVLHSQVAEQWVKRYNGPGNGIDNAAAMVLDGFGNIYVAATSFGTSSGFDYATIKYNSAGVQLWVAFYNGPGNDSDMVTGIAIDTSGNIIVTGYSEGTSSGFDFATVKYNNSGVQQWAMRYDGTANGHDNAVSVGVDAGGNVFVAGTTSSSGGTLTDYCTIKYSTAGVQMWAAVHNSLIFEDYVAGLAIDGLGNPCITGYVRQGQGYTDINTIKYNTNGVMLWETTRFSTGQNEVAQFITVDAIGNFCVTGIGRVGSSQDFIITIKYNSAGNPEWEKTFNGGSFEECRAASFDDSGNVLISAFSYNGGSGHNIITTKYDPFGVERWQNNYNGPGNGGDAAYSMTVDHSGNVYVTGTIWSGTSYDFGTIKYNLNGIQQWIKFYSVSPGINDNANSVRIDNCGNVYVTGFSGTDAATVRYSQITPNVPNLFFPSNNALNQPVSLNLIWNRSLCAANYTIQLAADSLFSSIIINDTTLTDTLRLVSGLNYSTNYWWKVNARTAAGTSAYSQIRKFRTQEPVGIQTITSEIPKEYRLFANYPNPFNPATKIKFAIPQTSRSLWEALGVELYVYNSIGQLVSTLVNLQLTPGTYEVEWDASNYTSGVYFYKLSAGVFEETKKMILLK